MKSLFTFNTGFARPSFVALGDLGQDEPTTMPDTSETGTPLVYQPPAIPSSNPWSSIVTSAAKAAVALKFPDLNKKAPAPTLTPAPSSTGTILAVLGGAAALGLGAWLIFKK